MTESFEPRILAYCCKYCAYAAADLAGSMRLNYLKINSLHKFTYIEIPVILGYTFSKNHFTFSLNSGIYWQYLINNPGSDLLFSHNNVKEEKLLYKKSNFSFYVSYSVAYSLTNRLSFSLDGFYKQSLSSIINDSQYKLSLFTIGIKFGFQYYFF